jgi:hypothetical protein
MCGVGWAVLQVHTRGNRNTHHTRTVCKDHVSAKDVADDLHAVLQLLARDPVVLRGQAVRVAVDAARGARFDDGCEADVLPHAQLQAGPDVVCQLDADLVRRDHDRVLQLQPREVVHGQCRRAQILDRHARAEEALDLALPRRLQVDGDDMVDAYCFKHMSHVGRGHGHGCGGNGLGLWPAVALVCLLVGVDRQSRRRDSEAVAH